MSGSVQQLWRRPTGRGESAIGSATSGIYRGITARANEDTKTALWVGGRERGGADLSVRGGALFDRVAAQAC